LGGFTRQADSKVIWSFVEPFRPDQAELRTSAQEASVLTIEYDREQNAGRAGGNMLTYRDMVRQIKWHEDRLRYRPFDILCLQE
jgi:hypothetical protein